MPSVQNLDQLLTLFTGSGKTTQTQTTTPNISKAGVDALIQQILESNQGLGAVASGQKSAGLYNSSTNQMLLNDLVARTGAETAKATSGTTTTSTSKTAGKADPMAMLALMGGKKLLNSGTIDPILKSLGIGGASAGAADALGAVTFGADAGAAAVSLADSLGVSMGSVASEGVPLFASGVDALGSFGSLLADGGFGGAGSVISGGLDILGDIFAGDATQIVGDAIGGSIVGNVAGSGAGALADILPALAWVICTELNARGILPTELYQASAQRALTLPKDVMDGYHWWAIPFVRQMRKPTIYGKFLTALATKVAIRRCEYLLGKPSFLGKLTVTIGEPLCAFIGRRISKVESYKTLYEVQ